VNIVEFNYVHRILHVHAGTELSIYGQGIAFSWKKRPQKKNLRHDTLKLGYHISSLNPSQSDGKRTKTTTSQHQKLPICPEKELWTVLARKFHRKTLA